MPDSGAINPLIQTGRSLAIRTCLGDDVLLLADFELSEAVCALFEFQVRVMSKTVDLKAADLIGMPADIELHTILTGATRVWNGRITQLAPEDYSEQGLRYYRLTLRPLLWWLTQTSDCRIVHSMTTQDITTLYFGERNIVDYRFHLVGSLPVRPYCVQYNETAFAYLTRLWEEDGLFWWFEHQCGKHTLVITDSATGYGDAVNASPRLGTQRNAAGIPTTDIHDWHETYEFISGQRTGQDWNFEQPVAPLSATSPTLICLGQNQTFELYEYPARVNDNGEASTAATLRMQALEAGFDVITGQCQDRNFAPGARFTPVLVPAGEALAQLVTTHATHLAHEGTYLNDGQSTSYTGSFRAIPATVRATPRRLTRRPRIDSVQTAIVTGPAGEEIYTDGYGRIQVRFHWDRRADLSCWLRVVQPWAGAGWGAQVIPRVGMEVAIQFEDGDPDRPLCIGAVVNPDTMPAYLLPTKKTRMVLRSKTYQGTGYNEMSMEDATGNEEYFMHAQKDMNAKVLNNQSMRVDVNAVESVGLNKGVEVDNNMIQVVAGDFSIAVGPGGRGRIVSSAATTQPTGVGRTAYNLGEPATAAKGTGNLSVSVEENMSETILKDRTEKVTQNKDSNVLQNYTIEVGQIMTINAKDKIILQAGKSQIVLEQDGTILINGQLINMSGQNQVVVTSDIVKVN